MVNPQLFEQLKDLNKCLKNTFFDRIERLDTTYEGTYIFARNGTYLEFLNTLGSKYIFWLEIGWFSKNPDIFNVDQLPDNFAELEWQTFSIKNEDYEPWYDAYISSPVEVPYHLNFTSWGVNYHKIRRKGESSNYSVEKFVLLQMDVPEAYLELVKHSSQWFPTKRKINKSKAILEVPQGHNDLFEIILNVDASLDKPKSVVLRAKRCDNDLHLSLKLGSLNLYTEKEEIIFHFTDV